MFKVVLCLFGVAGAASGTRLRHTRASAGTAGTAGAAGAAGAAGVRRSSGTAPAAPTSVESLLEAAASKVANSKAGAGARAGGEAGGEAGAKAWNPWGAAYPYATQPPYGPFPQPHPFAFMAHHGVPGSVPGMIPPNMYPNAGMVTNPYTGLTGPAPGVPPLPGNPFAGGVFGPMGAGNVSYGNLVGFPGSMMHPYGPMPLPLMTPGMTGFPSVNSNTSMYGPMYSPFNPYAMSAYHPQTHYNMGFYHGALHAGQGIASSPEYDASGNFRGGSSHAKDYHVPMPNLLPSMEYAPGTGRGVNVAVHDATLVPVPGLTGRSPTAIAQEVARDREERGRKPGWSPYGGVFNNPAAFSETDQGMLHTTLAGDGFMAPPLKNSYMSNGLGAGSTMYPVQLPNGMLMNVPADEISAYPNVMPTMVQGPLSAPNSVGQEYSSTNEALSNTGAKPWVSRLAGTQAEIAQQQEFYKQYALAGAQSMIGAQRQSEALAARLAALQANLEQSKRQAEHQKKYLDQVARRSAALEVDKHRVQAEAQLAAVTMQYQQVRNHDEQLHQAQLKVNAAKEGLLKQAYAFRSVVRSDTEAINKLVNPETSSGESGSEAGGEANGEKAKIEKEEKKVEDMQIQAAVANEKAIAKGAKAADAAVKQLESDPNKFVESGAESGSEASKR